MKQYELLYALPGELTDAELKGVRDRIDGLLSAAGATIKLNEYAGKVKLAYPVGAHRYGHYVLVRFSAEPAQITKIDADLRLGNEAIRHLIVNADEVMLTTVNLFARPDEERAPEPVAPVMAAPIAATALSQEDIDKKIDELLTEAAK